METKKGIEYLSQALAPAGVIAYAVIYMAYDRFYSGLGISPHDLGLDFSTTLARSVSFFNAIAINASYTTIGVFLFARFMLQRSGTVPTTSALFLRSLQVSLLMWLAWLSFGVHTTIDRAVSDVRSGAVVLPMFHTITGGNLLPIRADAVRVTRTAPAETNLGISSLESRKLLYLGSDNGDPASAWFYDAGTQSALRVPLASIVLEVSNCTEAGFPDERCKSVAGRE